MGRGAQCRIRPAMFEATLTALGDWWRWIAEVRHHHPTTNDLAGKAAAAAFGSGVGAYAAFRLQSLRERRDERKKHADAIRSCILALVSRRNFLMIFKRQFLDVHEADIVRRHLSVKPNIDEPTFMPIDIGSLAFLMRSKDGAILSEIDVAELEFMGIVRTIRSRSIDHFEMQRRIEGAGLKGDFIGNVELERAAGRDLIARIQNATDHIYAAIVPAIERNRELTDSLRNVLKRSFKREHVPIVADDLRKAV